MGFLARWRSNNTSTKANAAKYLFRVPEELWADVKGHGLRKEDGGDYEILWGRQGVVCGAYPGGKVSKPGEYIFEGDINNIPTAPDWLLAEMKQPPRTINKKSWISLIALKTKSNRSSLNVCQ